MIGEVAAASDIVLREDAGTGAAAHSNWSMPPRLSKLSLFGRKPTSGAAAPAARGGVGAAQPLPAKGGKSWWARSKATATTSTHDKVPTTALANKVLTDATSSAPASDEAVENAPEKQNAAVVVEPQSCGEEAIESTNPADGCGVEHQTIEHSASPRLDPLGVGLV